MVMIVKYLTRPTIQPAAAYNNFALLKVDISTSKTRRGYVDISYKDYIISVMISSSPGQILPLRSLVSGGFFMLQRRKPPKAPD